MFAPCACINLALLRWRSCAPRFECNKSCEKSHCTSDKEHADPICSRDRTLFFNEKEHKDKHPTIPDWQRTKIWQTLRTNGKIYWKNWVAKENSKFSKLNRRLCMKTSFLERVCMRHPVPSGWPCFWLPEGVGGEFPDKSLTNLPVAALPTSVDYPKEFKAIYSKHSTQNILLNTTKSQHVGLMQASNNPLSSTWVIFLRAPASSRRIKQARESKKQENNSHHDNHARSSRTLATQLVFCAHCTTQHTGLCRYITYATGS